MPALTIDVRLAATDTLPPLAAHSLAREVEAIWCRMGISVRWTAPEASDQKRDSSVRVAVVSWAVDPGGDDHDWPVGALLTTDSGSSIAVISVAAARRVIVAAGSAGDPDELADHRLGVILGRAVSHELGHYWLGRGHANRGLMRAHISATDFADLRDGGFGLDRSSVLRIRERLAGR